MKRPLPRAAGFRGRGGRVRSASDEVHCFPLFPHSPDGAEPPARRVLLEKRPTHALSALVCLPRRPMCYGGPSKNAPGRAQASGGIGLGSLQWRLASLVIRGGNYGRGRIPEEFPSQAAGERRGYQRADTGPYAGAASALSSRGERTRR